MAAHAAAPTATLADALVTRSVAANWALMAGGVALVSSLAYVEVPMWPVPVTGQTLGVVLVGAALGARRAAGSLTLYMLLGLAGLPIFAGGTGGPWTLLKPTFGYIVGFIAAAALVGWLAERQWDRRPLLALPAFFLASAIPFITGVPYLGFILARAGQPADVATLVSLGVTPFLLGGAIKWLLAAALFPLLWHLVRRTDDNPA